MTTQEFLDSGLFDDEEEVMDAVPLECLDDFNGTVWFDDEPYAE
jgi:hypothetical protein